MSTDLAFYGTLLADIKTRIRHAQNRAALAVNAELVRLYWDIGRLILARQQQEGWGAGVIPRLARDLHNELPEVKGFSDRNIKRMVQFAREYTGLFSIGPRTMAQLGDVLQRSQPAAFSRALRGVPRHHRHRPAGAARGTTATARTRAGHGVGQDAPGRVAREL